MSRPFYQFFFVFFITLIQTSFSSIHIAPTREQLQYAFFPPSHSSERLQRRSASEQFQITIHYDLSVKRLLQSEQDFVQRAVEAATDYWSRTIRPKYKLTDRIRLMRKCSSRRMFIVENDYSIHYCLDECANETLCGDVVVPDAHLRQCHICTEDKVCGHVGSNGYGVNAEFILYVSAIDTDRCQPPDILATASFCQLEPEFDRPIAGNVNVCSRRFKPDLRAIDYDRFVSAIKHEILHTLAFSTGLFAFFRDEAGEPLTQRDPITRWPITYDRTLQVYRPSERILKTIMRDDWQVRGGIIEKQVTLVVTPKVQEAARAHFGCPTLEGAELEDQGNPGTALTHWEKRLFEHELMTGTCTQDSVVSNITLALLEDSGWYEVSYGNAQTLSWGQNLSCTFAQKSCKEWIDTQLANQKNPYPFCVSSPKSSLARRSCAVTHDRIVMCNLVEYNQELPVEYQIFDSLPGVIDPDELGRVGGHVMLANYCPYNQELAYQNSQRDSRCYRTKNQPSSKENYALETYSLTSKCFDHGSVWEQYIDGCRRKRRIFPQIAGCYQFECIPSRGILVRIGIEEYLCEYSGQNLTIVTHNDESIYVGSLICPDCQIICGSSNGFQCPSNEIFSSPLEKQVVNTRFIVEYLCHRLNRRTMSDTNQSSRVQSKAFLLFVLLYLHIVFGKSQ